jgi:hypothetical protein
MVLIHEVAPREIAGRDMILRVNMQHQAAAYAALQVLDGGAVDRVYCDYHDDFVVRRRSAGRVSYHFFQVKTKGKLNHQWSLSEVFALKKRQATDDDSLHAVKESFAGRLIHHSIVFGDSCDEVTLLSNVHFSDDVEDSVAELSNGAPSKKLAQFFLEQFNSIFQVNFDDAVKLKAVRKLTLLPGVKYIGDEQTDFATAARYAIHHYSEIDLEQRETIEIASNLVSLVNRKSCSKLANITPLQLDDHVGVGIDDLLSVLSISKEAYYALKDGEDPKALKTASFIQRKLKAAGVTESMIEFASVQKVQWDIWLRNARHTYPEFDLNFLLQRIDEIRSAWLSHGGEMTYLNSLITTASEEGPAKSFPSLDKNLIFGGVIAAWVRSASA